MLSRLIIACISLYRIAISPLLPHSCRFTPTCSAYAIEAIRYHGICKGFLCSVGRVLRCNPWNAGGIDPVPPPRKGSWLCH